MIAEFTNALVEDNKNNSLSTNLSLTQQKSSPIRPPTPPTPAAANVSATMYPTSSSYSLFESSENNTSVNYAPWDWLPGSNSNTQLYRKHSINADGDDFLNSPLPNSPSSYNSSFASTEPRNYWRRASEPNSAVHATQLCSSCLNKHTQLFTPSCAQHQFCHSCSTAPLLNLLMQGICPRCTQTANGKYNMPLATKPSITNASADYFVHQYQKSAQFSSTSQMMSHTYSSSMSHYPCVKLSNIPWDVSQNDVRHFFGNCRSPSMSVCTQSIHIMMDRTTGKTLSDAYVEFASVADMRRAIDTRHQKPLKGRVVSVYECSQEELLSVIFPKWRGQFHGTLAIPPASEIVRTMSTAAGGGNSGCPPFITREEINSLLVICKNYKLHFSRKCAERPFENIISVIAKYPWSQSQLISTMHRDHVYEMLKLSIESLKTHLSKDYVQIDSTLLERLTRAGIMCPAFTERQKTTLLQTARIECPADIESFLLPTANTATFSYQTPATTPGTEVQQLSITKPRTFPLYSPYNVQQPLEYFSNKDNYWEYTDSGNEDDDLSVLLLSPNDSPISSLIRDIQRNCNIDDKDTTQTPKKTFAKSDQLVNCGIPLLLQPITNATRVSGEQKQEKSSGFHKPIRQLSPWATSYAPKSSSIDIWRIPTNVEYHHGTSSSLLAA